VVASLLSHAGNRFLRYPHSPLRPQCRCAAGLRARLALQRLARPGRYVGPATPGPGRILAPDARRSGLRSGGCVSAHCLPAAWLTTGSRFTPEQSPVAGTVSPG